MVGEKYVARAYGKFRTLYWADVGLPDWDEFDFEFSEGNDQWEEWGSFDIIGGVPILRIHPDLRKYSDLLKATLLHEMTHMVIAYRDTGGLSKLGHGPAFRREAQRIHEAGCWRWYF